MLRRLFWALFGLALGAVLGVRLSNMVHRTRERTRPGTIAEGAGRGVGTLQARLSAAVAEGRAAAAEREQLLRTRFGVRSMAELAAEAAEGATTSRPGDPAPTAGDPRGDVAPGDDVAGAGTSPPPSRDT